MKAWFTLWDLRNKERHGKDQEAHKAKRLELLTAQLNQLYALKHAVLPAHKKLFLRDSTQHLQLRPNLDGLEDWINTFGPAIRSSAKHALDIGNYFLRTGDPPG